MTIRVYVNSAAKRTETIALVDCGATENFIDTDHAYAMRLPLKRLAKPREVFNVDKTPNRQGPITHYTDLTVRTGTQTKKMRFFLTHLGGNPIILGYPWFAAMEPHITWSKGWINYDQLPIVLYTPWEEDSPTCVGTPTSEGAQTCVETPTNELKRIITAVISANDRRMLASKLVEEHQGPPMITLPEEYQRHAQVFSEEKAQRFPEPRIWDHAIELKKDAPATLPGKIYALTQEERKALRTFIEEHLRKGYIVPSKSPYAAPFFFIKKKDGKLRPVQDYRRLNEHTIRNRYPLPLIPELISQVQDAALFSKFDVRWGYHNIRIKAEDQWKAAFITNEGLFEPRVMFFGLTNSPATFQTMMNAIFAEELRQDWLTIYMDDILVHTLKDEGVHRQSVTN
jgi:Reverse transcriptase (RNA-dependent DNA polymerase)